MSNIELFLHVLLREKNKYDRIKELSIGDYVKLKGNINETILDLKKLINNNEKFFDTISKLRDSFHIDISNKMGSIANAISLKDYNLFNREIEPIINELNERIENTTRYIELKRIEKYKFSVLFDYFDLKNNKLKMPIEDINIYEKIELFLKTVDKDESLFTEEEKVNVLFEINKQNNLLLLERDKKLLEKQIEEKKKANLIKIRNQRRNRIANVHNVEVNIEREVSLENQLLLETAKQIIVDNKDIINGEFDEEVIEAFELIRNDDIHSYDMCLTDINNYYVTLLDINELYNKCLNNNKNEDFILLKNAIDEYNNFKQKLEEERNGILKVQEFEENNKDILTKMKEYSSEFSKLYSKYSNNMISITSSLEETKEDEKLEKLKDLCEFLNIDEKLYLSYKMLEEIHESCVLYELSENLEDKQQIINEVNSVISHYEDSLNDRKINEEDFTEEEFEDFVIDPTKEKLNEVLFLTKNGITIIEDFIKNNSNKDYNNRISDLYDYILMLNYVPNLHDISIPVLDENHQPTKIRRTRKGDYRVVSLRMNNQEFGIEKPLYLIISAGIKSGEDTLYDYINSSKIQNLVNDYIENIRRTLINIDNENISDEEKNKKKESYVKALFKNNIEMYEASIDRLKSQFERSMN